MKCRICGSENLRLFYSQGSHNQFKFYRCSNCKLVNLDLENIKIVENQNKYVEVFNPPKDYEKSLTALSVYQFINRYMPSKGKYLDIGCGSGTVLYFFKKHGWQVRGLELSEVFANHVKEKLGIDVDVANFMDYKGDEFQYDLVSLRHVLEHIPDSISALNKINALLRNNGFALFEFPNINSLSHRAQRLLIKLKLKRKVYKDTYVPGHCNEFCKSSFIYLMNKTGFKLIKWETYSNKGLTNFIYNHIHLGTKVRVLVQKVF